MHDAPTARVLVVRHGETDWNRADRIQGWAPVGLNERGREQARTAGDAIAGAFDVDRLIASDLRRCRETVALLREAGVKPEPTFEGTWRERDFGVFQGLSREDIFGEYPEYDATERADAIEATPPEGESLRDLRERVLEAWRALPNRAPGETVLLVTHGGPSHVIFGHARDLDLQRALIEHDMPNCGLLECRVSEAETTLRDQRTLL